MVAAILLSSLAGTPTLGVPIPYEFVRNESILTVDGTFTFFIEGSFDLVYDLDTGAAFFQQVNATFDREVAYFGYPRPPPDQPEGRILFTTNPDVLFELTKLESVYVSDTQIDFLLEKNIPRFPRADVHLTVAFLEDSVEITGYFSSPVVDGFTYRLHAAGLVVPEPTSVFLLCGGLLCVRKRALQRKA